jgi:hypothetical protein
VVGERLLDGTKSAAPWTVEKSVTLPSFPTEMFVETPDGPELFVLKRHVVLSLIPEKEAPLESTKTPASI